MSAEKNAAKIVQAYGAEKALEFGRAVVEACMAEYYPGASVDSWSEPTEGYMMGAGILQMGRWHLRTIRSGPRAGEQAWFDRRRQRLMPTGWSPGDMYQRMNGTAQMPTSRGFAASAAGPDADEARNRAKWYAGVLNLLEKAGEHTALREVADEARDDLRGSGWTVARAADGWAAADDSDDDEVVVGPHGVEVPQSQQSQPAVQPPPQQDVEMSTEPHPIGQPYRTQTGSMRVNVPDRSGKPHSVPYSPHEMEQPGQQPAGEDPQITGAQPAPPPTMDQLVQAPVGQLTIDGTPLSDRRANLSKSLALSYARRFGGDGPRKVAQLASHLEKSILAVKGDSPGKDKLRYLLQRRLEDVSNAAVALGGANQQSQGGNNSAGISMDLPDGGEGGGTGISLDI